MFAFLTRSSPKKIKSLDTLSFEKFKDNYDHRVTKKYLPMDIFFDKAILQSRLIKEYYPADAKIKDLNKQLEVKNMVDSIESIDLLQKHYPFDNQIPSLSRTLNCIKEQRVSLTNVLPDNTTPHRKTPNETLAKMLDYLIGDEINKNFNNGNISTFKLQFRNSNDIFYDILIPKTHWPYGHKVVPIHFIGQHWHYFFLNTMKKYDALINFEIISDRKMAIVIKKASLSLIDSVDQGILELDSHNRLRSLMDELD